MQGQSEAPQPFAEPIHHTPRIVLQFKTNDEVVGITDQSCPAPQSRLHLLFEPKIKCVCSPPTRTLAYLRFASLVTEAVARLTTSSGGLTPRRAGFAPAGQNTKFHGVIAYPPIPIDQQCLVALNFLYASARLASLS
jgi:hypothetical protein